MNTERPGATAAHVTYEVNLIGRNHACLGPHAAAAATAEHIERFWSPLLRTSLLAQARRHPEAFNSVARAAIAMLSGSEGKYIS